MLVVSPLSCHPSANSHSSYLGGIRSGGTGMRASHFAEIAVAIATLIATYLLFDGEQQLAALPAGQLRNNEEAAPVGKSDRLAVKEDEAVEEPVFSPKPVRLEKYYRPADGDLNAPKWDQLSYLADYVYSEVPPERKPADTVREA